MSNYIVDNFRDSITMLRGSLDQLTHRIEPLAAVKLIGKLSDNEEHELGCLVYCYKQMEVAIDLTQQHFATVEDVMEKLDHPLVHLSEKWS
jgi:hypothetical protein